MKLLTAAGMREADRRTIEEFGLPGRVLMECAGRGVVEALVRRYGDVMPGPVAVLCGKGNNGGDGLVAARHLLERGWQVDTLVLAAPESLRGDVAANYELLLRAGGVPRHLPDEAVVATTLTALRRPRLIVDALLGTGLDAAPAPHLAAAIGWIRDAAVPVVAVDLPSGLDSDSGRPPGAVVRAELTVTFAAAKLGQVLNPGVDACGELVVVDIGIPGRILAEEACGVLLDAAEVAALLPARPATGHKGTFGHLLLLAGSEGKSGAAALAAGGALRVGSGLVTVAAPRSAQQILAVKLTEAMTAPLAEDTAGLTPTALTQCRALCGGKSALVVGPGLGEGVGTRAVVRELLATLPLPLVLDADGLNTLAGDTSPLKRRPCGTTILTPHPGEMARLTGLTVAQVQTERVAVARAFAERHGVVVVLKGARTVVAAPDGGFCINPTGHVGMGSGGTGDVLAGMIGGLLAQGLPPVAAAAAGVWLHGAAGDRLRARFGDAGLLAGDLLPEIPAARYELFDKRRPTC